MIGLPANLLPPNVASYTYSEIDGSFEVCFTHEVVTEIANEDVKFEEVIKGKMTELALFDLLGVKTKQFFWLTIGAITRPARDSEKIYFKVGPLKSGIPVSAFKDPIKVS
ncbi:hypothetical protein KFL_003090150 [Klebsormidium nitens]|uniref:Uncharacterized protein n=1 Tax=Klebsormidium nitens TaxID=105231 RepID=A0A1Y1IF69_KLENI|nr:hypothetical protein KFL_003090150 [Klebsormidium nitens]|eukprot:GAQ86758.1 hypothetical protein KFL_003090150 [Klebsormidium nitens]